MIIKDLRKMSEANDNDSIVKDDDKQDHQDDDEVEHDDNYHRVLLPHLVGGPWICGTAPNVPHTMLRACTSTSTKAHQLAQDFHLHSTEVTLAHFLQ